MLSAIPGLILLRICQQVCKDSFCPAAAHLSSDDSTELMLLSVLKTMQYLVQSQAVIKDSSEGSVPTAAQVKSICSVSLSHGMCSPPHSQERSGPTAGEKRDQAEAHQKG